VTTAEEMGRGWTIGHADGQELDMFIGALTMERWEMKLYPKSLTLDLEGLRRREFTEFPDLDRGATHWG
jgi:hypothetical protein